MRSRSGKTRTFKPRKDVPEGTKQYQLRKYAEATLVGTHFGVERTIWLMDWLRVGLWEPPAGRAAPRWRG